MAAWQLFTASQLAEFVGVNHEVPIEFPVGFRRTWTVIGRAFLELDRVARMLQIKVLEDVLLQLSGIILTSGNPIDRDLGVGNFRSIFAAENTGERAQSIHVGLMNSYLRLPVSVIRHRSRFDCDLAAKSVTDGSRNFRFWVIHPKRDAIEPDNGFANQGERILGSCGQPAV